MTACRCDELCVHACMCACVRDLLSFEHNTSGYFPHLVHSFL